MQNDPTRVNLQEPRRPGTRRRLAALDDDTLVDRPAPTPLLVELMAGHRQHADREHAGREDVRRWVCAGADIQTPDRFGVTALMLAAGRGQLDVVAYLIGRGAPVNVTEPRGYTAFGVAAWRGHSHVLAYLKSRGANPNAVAPLFDAVRAGRSEVVNLLLEHGTSVDLRDRSGNTPLMIAAGRGHTDLVRCLLGRGASRGARNGRGDTALRRALGRGKWGVVGLLQGGGVRPLRCLHNLLRVALARPRAPHASGCGEATAATLQALRPTPNTPRHTNGLLSKGVWASLCAALSHRRTASPCSTRAQPPPPAGGDRTAD